MVGPKGYFFSVEVMGLTKASRLVVEGGCGFSAERARIAFLRG